MGFVGTAANILFVLWALVFLNNYFTPLEIMDWKLIFKTYFQKCTFDNCSFILVYLMHINITFMI